jgi:hypothetical protein
MSLGRRSVEWWEVECDLCGEKKMVVAVSDGDEDDDFRRNDQLRAEAARVSRDLAHQGWVFTKNKADRGKDDSATCQECAQRLRDIISDKVRTDR